MREEMRKMERERESGLEMGARALEREKGVGEMKHALVFFFRVKLLFVCVCECLCGCFEMPTLAWRGVARRRHE